MAVLDFLRKVGLGAVFILMMVMAEVFSGIIFDLVYYFNRETGRMGIKVLVWVGDGMEWCLQLRVYRWRFVDLCAIGHSAVFTVFGSSLFRTIAHPKPRCRSSQHVPPTLARFRAVKVNPENLSSIVVFPGGMITLAVGTVVQTLGTGKQTSGSALPLPPLPGIACPPQPNVQHALPPSPLPLTTLRQPRINYTGIFSGGSSICRACDRFSGRYLIFSRVASHFLARSQ
ncbi:hypothetical protein HOY80DRAFT_55840 [Tuber brumale]|nr:hypothetical protein HOY80DRAFT_55840 [Tuber brumale]